jgi:hypothetical protein
MNSSQPTLPATTTSPTKLVLFPHQEIEFRAQQTHELIISIGGVGSGKTTAFVLWLLDRMKWDTGQVHALFAYTTVQLRAVMRVIYKQLDRIPRVRNHERAFGTRPPKAWIDDWQRRQIPNPGKQDRYENMVIWPCGLHLQLGTVHNRSYEQYRGSEWGSLGFEEFTLHGVTKDAFDFLDERVRCGDGDGDIECSETLGHRHTKILHGNPPESADHWTWEMLEALEREASSLPGATPRQQGDEGYPNLVAGVGQAILIQSRTTDNKRVGKRYVERKLARLDKETAARRLGGQLTRTKTGRAYSEFSQENIRPIEYHPDRTLYVNLDFNNRPIVAGLCHPLNPGEYDSKHEREGISHVGKFGEVFDLRGGGLQALCPLLLQGDVGDSGAAPSNWRGLFEHKGPVIFFGDGTGLNNQASGKTLWSIVDELIGTQLIALDIGYSKKVSRNKLVPLRVRATNAKFCSAAGIRSFWIAPWCVRSVADYTRVEWDPSKQDVKKYGERGGSDQWTLTHASDGDSYMLDALFPLGREHDPDSETRSGNLPPRTSIPSFLRNR